MPRMRAVYRLLGLARRFGGPAVNTACGKALEVDVISVTKIASMLERAGARFARDPGEYATAQRRLRVVTPAGTAGEEVR
jgi:hypothetical protein